MHKFLIALFISLSVLPGLAQENRWQRAGGAFEYRRPGLTDEKSVTVHYYVPAEGEIRSMRVLFVLHGAERDASFSLHMWRYFAEKEKFIVIAPEFSRGGYPENDYQLGGVFRTKEFKKLNPPEYRTYAVIEELFDLFKLQTGNGHEQYDIWGHSAGGQFVHRFLLAVPHARVNKAVASNPGFWTFPIAEGIKDKNGTVYGWPYSVKETPFGDTATIRLFLARQLIVHLGNADLKRSGKYVPTGSGALLQGANRFERGLNFFRESEHLARRLGVPFNWRLVVVDGVGHSGHGMVYGKMSVRDGVQVFSTARTAATGAYSLIYGRENTSAKD